MKNNKNIRIGIWGYGVVGKAMTRYFLEQGHVVGVMDQRSVSHHETHNTKHKNRVTFYTEEEKNKFFILHDYLFSSPGVNVANDYQTHKHKWLCELDLFQSLFAKPIIAVTGSIGKTSVMHMLSAMLFLAQKKQCFGGNIGTPTFDLLEHTHSVDVALLEVSSFQLQYCQTFAPDLAIWTNLYPNHLDHHASQQEYLLAKYAILKQQKNPQAALIDLSLREKIPAIASDQLRYYYSFHKPTPVLLASMQPNERVYFLENNTVMCYDRNACIPLITLDAALLAFSFVSNIILLSAVCHILNFDQQLLYSIPTTAILPEHRLEKVATVNNVDFYNDSKSTTTASTLAAVHKLSHRPLHLFIGGLSKGVNREPFIAALKPHIKQVYCFGAEAYFLHNLCKKYHIVSHCFTDLETALHECLQQIQHNEIVLFSPAGSSYDLYNNFEERGTHFKNLIQKMT